MMAEIILDRYIYLFIRHRYGNVVSFSVANQLVVVLQDYDVMKEAFAQHQLSGRPTLEIRQITLPGYGKKKIFQFF